MSNASNGLEGSWAWSNSQWVPLGDCRWSWSDLGPMHGVIAVERLRTFHGQPYLVDEHLRRLDSTCEQLFINLQDRFSRSSSSPTPSWHDELSTILGELLDRNQAIVRGLGDVGIVILASPGDPGWDASSISQPLTPSLHIHLVSIPWKRFAHWYEHGCQLVSSSVHNIPASCWSPHIKSRNRLHYYLADKQAERKQSGAVALLLDQNEMVTETSISNLLMVRGSELISPTLEQILPGISLQTVEQLAVQIGRTVRYSEVGLKEFAQAEEILMVGTTGCVWPAVELDGRPIGDGVPGRCFRELVRVWQETLHFDFVGQAQRYAR